MAELNERRGSSAAQGYGAAWRKLRGVVLREQPICRACQMAPASEVDHVLPKRDGGTDDRGNLQGLCKPCHSSKTAREVYTDGGAGSRVVLVCGPPGSGKSTYVAWARKWGDLVVDYDALLSALSGLPMYEKPAGLRGFAAIARDAVIARIRGSEVGRAWVISSAAGLATRERFRSAFGAQVVVLEVSAAECAAHVRGDSARSGQAEETAKLAEAWWRDYRRSSLDTVCTPADRKKAVAL